MGSEKWEVQMPRQAHGARLDRTSRDRYLSEQLITCIGNKRRLLHTLDAAAQRVRQRLGGRTLTMLDAFAGSGVVSRLFKRHARALHSNDIERYAQIAGECYLANRSGIDLDALRHHHERVVELARSRPITDGFIRRLYAPRDDHAIQHGERVFYTSDNAIRIDSLRHHIDSVPKALQVFLLAPLLSEASIHANTSGVFKGFYKDVSGIGRFGGDKCDALTRILGRIELPFPLFSEHECEIHVHRQSANELVRSLKHLDLAYLDPPYNQHPYGSNYFMLNLIAANEPPEEISPVSGIPTGWRRSAYNKRSAALDAMADLVAHTDASHLLISYNSEGFIARPEFEALLKRHGRLEVIETKYNTFRGSRNLRNRPLHVREHLFLLERA